MPYGRFLAANACGGIAWAAGMTYLIWFLGVAAEQWLSRLSWLGLAVAAVAGVTISLLIRKKVSTLAWQAQPQTPAEPAQDDGARAEPWILAGPLAGSLKMPYGRFLAANACGGIAWAAGMIYLIWFLGVAAEQWLSRLSWLGLAVAAVAGVTISMLIQKKVSTLARQAQPQIPAEPIQDDGARGTRPVREAVSRGDGNSGRGHAPPPCCSPITSISARSMDTSMPADAGSPSQIVPAAAVPALPKAMPSKANHRRRVGGRAFT